MNPLAGMIGSQMGGMQSMLAQISGIKRMLQGKDPNAVTQMFAERNPQFAQFLRDNRGKSPQQIAADYGLDWGMVQDMLK